MFDPTSRYAKIEEGAHTEVVDGTSVVHRYKKRRFLPAPGEQVVLTTHVTRQGDRIDRIAAAYYGASEEWYRVCDANPCTAGADLVGIPGRRVNITMPKP